MKIENIRFKAKRLDNNTWVEGYFYAECGNTYIIENRQEESMLNRNITYEVDPSTVCQFTGLKDTNDVPIFEGDIIDFDGEGEVVFKDGAFYAKFGKYTECLLCNLVKSGLSVTIVGNKFDKKK
nr:MAG TPA: YopX protein [Caudoviricetes sp.]